jgi:phosphate transport system permease protein
MPALPKRPGVEILAERAIEVLIRLCGISAILFVFGIFFFVFREGSPLLFHGFNFREFFFSPEWYPTSQHHVRYGVLALIAGTASVTLLSMVLAVPFGIGTVELLAAIPSVVWGFVGLTVMNKVIIELFHTPIGLNVLNGGVILALMSVPIIVSIGEDALKAVPDSYREAAVALGVTRWQLIYRVLVPAARNGLLAAVLLGVGRAAGETMAVLMATGHAVKIPTSLLDSVRTLTATIAAELGEAAVHSDHYQVLFIIGILLFIITFAINLAADLIVRGVRRG